MEKIRYAVIGTGNRGRHLIKAALQSGQVEIAAIADPHPQSLRLGAEAAGGARTFSDYRQMLEWGKFDAVVIASPNDLHEQMLEDALQSDVHILCEKPLANSLAAIDRVLEKLRGYRKVFQIGMELRHHPMYRQLKEAVRSGRIGPVRMMWCREFRVPFRDGVDNWRHSRERTGGSLLEKNCHHFDLFNWFADSRPVRVSAVGGSRGQGGEDNGMADHAWVNVEYENGIKASLGLALFLPHSSLELGLAGDDGTAVCTSPDEKLAIKSKGGDSLHDYGHLDDSPFDHGGEVEQHLAFVERIRTGRPPEVKPEEIRDAHLICLAAEKSMRTGQLVDLTEGDPAE